MIEESRYKLYQDFSLSHQCINVKINLHEFESIWLFVLEEGLKQKSFNISNSYLKLLSFETKLVWKGFFKKVPIFEPHPRISSIENMKKGFTHNMTLINKLNSDDKLISSLRNSVVTDIEIKLADFRLTDSFNAFLDFISHLEDLRWVVTGWLTIFRNTEILGVDNTEFRISESQDILQYISRLVIEESYQCLQ